jgi:AcrR family transcriptional regulator
VKARKPTEERRREIADAAIRILGDRGLRDLTAAQLAHEVGVSDAAIFRHFRDMGEVAHALLDRLTELLMTPPSPIQDPLERLRAFLSVRLRSVSVQPCIQSLLFSDQISHILADDGPRRVAELRNRGREFIRSCLSEAVAKGLVRGDLDIAATVVLITGIVMSMLFAAKDGALPASPEEMEGRMWRVVEGILQRSGDTP